MNFKLILLILIIIFGCQSERQKKIEAFYYPSKNLKQQNFYNSLTNKLDSSKTYYDSQSVILKIKDSIINDSIIKSTFFLKNGSVKAKGFYKKGVKFNNWDFFREDGTLSQIVEYLIIDGKEYVNQRWRYDKKGSLLYNGSHYYDYEISSNTIKINEDVKFIFHLTNPFFSAKSDVYVLIPKINYKFNQDFSNINEIELDTIHSLVETHGLKNQNLSVAFALNFSTSGNKKIKAILVEEIDKDRMQMDSLDILQTRIYFENEIYVVPPLALVCN